MLSRSANTLTALQPSLQVMDKHMGILAQQHVETKFVKVSVLAAGVYACVGCCLTCLLYLGYALPGYDHAFGWRTLYRGSRQLRLGSLHASDTITPSRATAELH